MHMRSEGRAGRIAVSVGRRRFCSIPQSLARSRRLVVAILQTTLAEIVPGFPLNKPAPEMRVRKRNGSWEPVDVNKIVRAFQRCCRYLFPVYPMRVASRTIGGLYDGATTSELDS